MREKEKMWKYLRENLHFWIETIYRIVIKCKLYIFYKFRTFQHGVNATSKLLELKY